ncbi:MAG: Cell cycle response regulator CtrA [Planctomycetota bacterium]|jgi:CheY-like chemotaxis protein
MTGQRKRMLVFGRGSESIPHFSLADDPVDVVRAGDVHVPDAVADYVLVAGCEPQQLSDVQVGALGVFHALPDAVVLLDDALTVLWHNQTFQTILQSEPAVRLVGCPLQDVIAPMDGTDLTRVAMPTNGGAVELQVRRENRTVLSLRLSRRPINLGDGKQCAVILTVRDVTALIHEKQKQDAIYRAGLELGNLSPDEVTGMTPDERVAILKEQILQLTQEVLGYDRFEIRLLNTETNELQPLLEFGMAPEAASRRLYAEANGNGVTGFVAWSKRSYLCVDTKSDQLYLCGAADARSSLTVPLMIRDVLLGTFNVEGPGTKSFSEKDLEFLVLFGRVVASSLNQLQLLEAEKATVTTENADRLRREVAEPSDEILKAATWILDRYVGHDPDLADRLDVITRKVRKIRLDVGAVVGLDASPGLSSPAIPRPPRSALRNRRVLVTDEDARTREEAHTLLEQMGCEVDAVTTAGEACSMLRNHAYDVVLIDIRLSDANGYECFRRLREINTAVPIIMMTSFGYDSTHSIVKARQEGLRAVLYKPFRRAQMLDEIEKAVASQNR